MYVILQVCVWYALNILYRTLSNNEDNNNVPKFGMQHAWELLSISPYTLTVFPFCALALGLPISLSHLYYVATLFLPSVWLMQQLPRITTAAYPLPSTAEQLMMGRGLGRLLELEVCVCLESTLVDCKRVVCGS